MTQKNPFEKLGAFLIRYGLVLVLAWIGAMKFLLKDIVLLGAALFTLGDSLASD